jgi:hypothetical protein
MKKRPGQEAAERLARSMGKSVEELEGPFKQMHAWGQQMLHDWLVALTEDERKFAIWLIDRNRHAEKLQSKVMGTFLGNIANSIATILWWHLKNAIGIKQRDIGERDPNRPWNEKYYDYDNDWYRYADETDRLKVELFGNLSPEQRRYVDSVVHMFNNDAFFNWSRAVELKERISKNHVEERTELLKKWLADPRGEPPAP